MNKKNDLRFLFAKGRAVYKVIAKVMKKIH